MKTIRSYKIHSHIEPFGYEVFQVNECHHTNRLIEFHNNVKIAVFGLVVPGVRAKDANAPDMIPLLKLMPHDPQLIQNGRSIPHGSERILILQIYE